jgi:hypothetical protein
MTLESLLSNRAAVSFFIPGFWLSIPDMPAYPAQPGEKRAGPLKRNRPDKSHRENAQDFFFFVTRMSMPGAICCNWASPSLAC